MTNKEIIKMATNKNVLYYMNKINEIESCMCSKTPYEIIQAKRQIKDCVSAIKLLME